MNVEQSTLEEIRSEIIKRLVNIEEKPLTDNEKRETIRLLGHVFSLAEKRNG